MEAPDKSTLTGFTPRTQGEIDRHLFAARTGGLVSLGAAAFWELFHAATAWHEHLKAPADAVAAETERCARICDGWAETQVDGAVASMCAHDIRGLPDVPGSLKPSTAMQRVAALESVLRDLLKPLPPIGDRRPSDWTAAIEAEMGTIKLRAQELLAPQDAKPRSVLAPSPLAPQARDTTPSEEA